MKIFVFFILFPFLAFAKGFVPSSFTANYEESVVSLVNGKEKKSFGKIDYKFPGNLRFEVTSPVPSLFVVNPKKSWLYQPSHIKGEQDQVTVQNSSNLPLIKFLDSVKNGIEGSKIFKAKHDKNDLVLTFVKTIQKEMGFVEVVLHSSRVAKEVKSIGGFQQITLRHTNGSKTSIRLIDLKEDVPFASNYFEFNPSANTKVIKN